MKAKCLRIEYEPGERFTCQGVKGFQSGKRIGGRFFQSAGYGVGQYFISSKLLLYIKVGTKKHILRVDRFFKDKLGKLTEQRRELLSRTMPTEIDVKKIKEQYLCEDPEVSLDERTLQYAAVATELDEWLAKVQALIADPKAIRSLKKALKEKKEAEEKALEAAEKESFREYAREIKKARAEEKKRLEERRKSALKLPFTKGRNPKYDCDQWEAQHEGRLYVLRREDSYDSAEGPIPIEKVFDLVQDRIVLVSRI